MASAIKEVNPRLDKRPLVFNGRLANRRLTSLVIEANDLYMFQFLSTINHHITLTKADMISEKSVVHCVIHASGGLMKLYAILLLKKTGQKPTRVVIGGLVT